MSVVTHQLGVAQRPPTAAVLTLDRVQSASLWLMFASSFFVSFEPAPCDMIFVAAMLLHVWRGLNITVMLWPMIFYLVMYNIGGFISYLEVSNESKASMFVITTAYMSMSALFVGGLTAEKPLQNTRIIKSGWVIGAFIASIFGIIGYFNIAGLGPLLAPITRAQGFFKDPNVLSTYLIPPALLLIQDIMLGGTRHRALKMLMFLVIIAAWFLAFSRGAWLSLIGATMMMAFIMFVLTPSAKLRGRIILMLVAGAVLSALVVAVLLSIPGVKELFEMRFSLVQSYDAGETGRFGNQINSIQYLLQRPLGFGPTLFREIFGADPHNVYLNAFASYGWIGGLSYFLLVVSTIAVGFRTVLIRTPWQNLAIAVFCGLFTTMLQGVQIDTDHWRHFYWCLGIVWGMFSASMMYRVPRHSEFVHE